MDSNSVRFPRGRARGKPNRPSNPQNQNPSRPQASRPQVPTPQASTPQASTSQASTPQASRPHVGRPKALRQHAPRPTLPATVTNIHSSDPNKEGKHVAEGVQNMGISTESSLVSVGIGKGTVHGNTSVEDDDKNFRVPRPAKSIGSTGKQGVYGKPIKLLTNYFPISSYTDWVLYQYRVNFSPNESRIGVQKGLLSVHKERLGAYIFDGSMLFSSVKYDAKTFELTSKRSSDDQLIQITITFTCVLDSGHYAYIQVFNLILRNCLRKLNLQLVGRNFYDANAQICIPSYKLVLWPGYECTISLYDSGLLMRSEISTKVMREETVLDFFLECLNSRHRNENWMTQFKAGVIGEVVMTRYNNKTYRIDDIDENADTLSTFEKKNGTKMSYIDYYKQKWNITIKGGKQPMLISKMKNLNKDKDVERIIYLVPELCVLTGLSESMRNNFSMMKLLAEYTCVGPTERIKRYHDFNRRLKSSPEAIASLNCWNMGLEDKLVEINSRVLPSETIYSNAKPYNAGLDADWSKSVRALPMFKTVSFKRWVVVCPAKIDLDSFLKSLFTVSKQMSFFLPQPDIITMNETHGWAYSKVLNQIIHEKNPTFILCILLTPRSDIYCLIKKMLCVDRAIPSQIVLAKHVSRINMSVLTKIAIQINCKLGGAPWKVHIPIQKYMIIGFDVCHDKQKKNISYGALVATTNDTQSSFFSCVQRHESGQELSNFFGTSIAKALLKYKQLNNEFPKGIIVYRDGVGDGQIGHVYKTEVSLIKSTCENLCPGAVPMLAFIIVKKRINTRFFLETGSHGAINPPPGTVVDSVVTDPTMFDFFLVSQNVRFGTVTPTHYNVIEDTTTISPDHLQRITYKLTHMYFNWAGTVSVPALCQLAHKLAFLAAQTLKANPNVGLDELLYFL